MSPSEVTGSDALVVISAKVPRWMRELMDVAGVSKSEVVRAALDFYFSAILYRNPEPNTFGLMLTISRALLAKGYRARFCERGCYDARRAAFYCGDR